VDNAGKNIKLGIVVPKPTTKLGNEITDLLAAFDDYWLGTKRNRAIFAKLQTLWADASGSGAFAAAGRRREECWPLCMSVLLYGRRS
jgi:hypothetical protein